MKVYYLSLVKLDKFKEDISKNLKDYQEGKLNFVKAQDLIRAQNLDITDFKFDMDSDKPSDSDYENIKRFYTAFKNLSDSQATEETLWAGLTHYSPFWEYVKYRWDCQTENEILGRYFFSTEGSRRPLLYNALARLWWYGRMTYDESAEDPFELTKYICESNLTLKGYLPLTLAYSNNRQIYQVFIRAIMNFEKKIKLNQEDHEKARRILLLWSGNLALDTLSDQELTEKITDYLNKLKGVK